MTNITFIIEKKKKNYFKIHYINKNNIRQKFQQ